jgi:hypothetical protein
MGIFFGIVAASLFGWAAWNVKADRYFAQALGIEYDRHIMAEVPS